MINPAHGFSMSAQDEFDFRPGISMIMPGALAGTPDAAGLPANGEGAMAWPGDLAAPNPGGTPGNGVADGTTMAVGEEDDASVDQAPSPDKNGLIGFFDPGSDPGGNRPAPSPDVGPNLPDQPFMGAWLDDMSFDLG